MAPYQEIMPFTKYWLWDVWYMFIRRAWQLSLKCEHSLWEQSVKERERQGLGKDREKRDRVLKEREMGMEWCLPTTTTTTATSSSPGSVDKHEELSCFSFTLYVGWMAGSATHRTSYGGFTPWKELYKYPRNLHTHTVKVTICYTVTAAFARLVLASVLQCDCIIVGLLFFGFWWDQRWTYMLQTIIDIQRFTKKNTASKCKGNMRIDLLMRNLSMNSQQPGSTPGVINRIM